MIISVSPVTMTREALPAGECLCSYCTAKCCRYFSVPLDPPETFKDFEVIRWYMLHGRVAAYMDEGKWYLAVYTVCDKLQDDFRCGIYHHRPQICRDYSTNECEFEDGGVHDLFFETPEQIYEYMEAFLNMDVEKEYWEQGKQLPMV